MTFLSTLILKDRTKFRDCDQMGKLSNFEMEDGNSETDHQTCSSRTDEYDLVLLAESIVSSEPEVKERRKADGRSLRSTKLPDPALPLLSPSSRKTNYSSQPVSTGKQVSEMKAVDLSECDVSISNLKVVEEASPSDRAVYEYGEAMTEEDLGTGTRTRSASMPLNEVTSPDPHSNRVATPEMKPCRSASLSHNHTQSNVLAGGGAFGTSGMRGPRALPLSSATRQPPISSLFSGANSPRLPRRVLSPQHVTKPLACVAENDASRELFSLDLCGPSIESTEKTYSFAPSKNEPLDSNVPSSKGILLGSNSSNSFGCISFDESDDDSDDDVLIEARQASSPTIMMAALQSKVDSSERSYVQQDSISEPCESDTSPQCSSLVAVRGGGSSNEDNSRGGLVTEKDTESGNLLTKDDEKPSPSLDASPRSPRRVVRSASGDLGKQQEVEMAGRLAKAKMLLGSGGMDDSPKEYTSPRSPRRVVRGNSGYFVHQEQTQDTSRLANAKILLDKDDEGPTISRHDSLSRSDNTHQQRRSSMGPLSSSKQTSASPRPRLLKTESAHLMYTKHEDLLAVYEKIIGAEKDTVDSRPQNLTTGGTKRDPSSARPTSRRLNLQKAQSVRYPMSLKDGELSGMAKASGQIERNSDQRECFGTPSRSRSLISEAFPSPFKKKTSNKPGKLKEQRTTENFDSPCRSSSLLSSWKRISPTRKSSVLALMKPLPILQGLAGPKTPKSKSEEDSFPTRVDPQHHDVVAVGSAIHHSNAHLEHNSPGKGCINGNCSPILAKRNSLRFPQRTQSLYSPGKCTEPSLETSTKCFAPERKSSNGNSSARMSFLMFEPLLGIPQADISYRQSVGLRKATSLRELDRKPSGDGLRHLFDKYSAIVDSPSDGICWK